MSLEDLGRHDEAVAAYRRAVAIEPRITGAQKRLRDDLIRRGRMEEARETWRTALEADPPEHDAWYGYAELCLFLGMEDEYLRSRRELLRRYGASTDPFIAERAARACLLRPLSGDELRTAATLGERAWSVDRAKYPGPYPNFLFLRGLAEYRLGRPGRAIVLMQGEASRVLGPAPGLVIAMAMHRERRTAEAREALATAVRSHDWSAARARDQDSWISHALRREAEGLILSDLPAPLEDRQKPRAITSGPP